MKKRKAINFDLSINELRKHFNNTARAYEQIKKFMLENGFEHRQYSGYASIEPISDRQITKIAERLNENFCWLSSCIQEIDVTDIGEQYSIKHIFDKDKTLNIEKEIAPLKENSQAQTNALESIKQKIDEFAQTQEFKSIVNSKKKKDKGFER